VAEGLGDAAEGECGAEKQRGGASAAEKAGGTMSFSRFLKSGETNREAVR